MDAALNRIKRKLEAAELQHLRRHALDLHERLEKSDERATRAEEMADWYHEQWMEHLRDLMEEGHQPMLTKAGDVLLENDTQFVIAALDFAIDFMAGFEDDPEQNLESRMKCIRLAKAKMEGAQ